MNSNTDLQATRTARAPQRKNFEPDNSYHDCSLLSEVANDPVTPRAGQNRVRRPGELEPDPDPADDRFDMSATRIASPMGRAMAQSDLPRSPRQHFEGNRSPRSRGTQPRSAKGSAPPDGRFCATKFHLDISGCSFRAEVPITVIQSPQMTRREGTKDPTVQPWLLRQGASKSSRKTPGSPRMDRLPAGTTNTAGPEYVLPPAECDACWIWPACGDRPDWSEWPGVDHPGR